MTSNTDTTTPTTRYTAESCHQLGYGWTIEAPATLAEDEVEELHSLLVEAYDFPSQESLDELLSEPHVGRIGLTNISELRKVRVEVKLVYREVWGQSFDC